MSDPISSNFMVPPSFTRGPWKLKRSGTITDADGDLVATTGYRVAVGSVEDAANAQLIATAPELLDALESICIMTSENSADVLKRARAVIARAKTVPNE